MKLGQLDYLHQYEMSQLHRWAYYRRVFFCFWILEKWVFAILPKKLIYSRFSKDLH